MKIVKSTQPLYTTADGKAFTDEFKARCHARFLELERIIEKFWYRDISKDDLMHELLMNASEIIPVFTDGIAIEDKE